MPRTRKDLIVEVLDLLGITQTGNDPEPEDMLIVDKMIDGKVAELARRRVLYLQDVSAIEDEFFLPLARIVGNAAGPKFGQPRDPNIDFDAERTLREMQPEPGAGDTVRADYF